MTVSGPTLARCCSALAAASRQSALSGPYQRSLTTAQQVLKTIQIRSCTTALLALPGAPTAARRSACRWKRSQASHASRWPLPNLRSLAAPQAPLQTTSTRSSKPLSFPGVAGGATPRTAAAQPQSCSQRAQDCSVRPSPAPRSRSSAAPREALMAMAWTCAAEMPCADSTGRPFRGVRAPPPLPRSLARGATTEQMELGTSSTASSRPPEGPSQTSTGCLMKNLIARGSVSTPSTPAICAETAGMPSRRVLFVFALFANTQTSACSSPEYAAAAHGSVQCSIAYPRRRYLEK
mmetsp:Transcript_94544/g.276254  ORF Transcript_94544/g.276254 Transcript_94544/m.276254 type:complete len:293 (-) Transcript_94544:1166-2044(-)